MDNERKTNIRAMFKSWQLSNRMKTILISKNFAKKICEVLSVKEFLMIGRTGDLKVFGRIEQFFMFNHVPSVIVRLRTRKTKKKKTK